MPRFFTTLFFSCLLLYATLITAQTINRDISYLSSGGKLHPLQANMDIRHYSIDAAINIDAKTISASAEITMVLAKTSDTILLDLIHLLDLGAGA